MKGRHGCLMVSTVALVLGLGNIPFVCVFLRALPQTGDRFGCFVYLLSVCPSL